jgi:hypothetical protein
MSAWENFQFFSGSSRRARKALLLLFLRKVQKELADHSAVARHVPLEAANVFEAFFPDILRHQSDGGSFSASSTLGCTRTTSTSS